MTLLLGLRPKRPEQGAVEDVDPADRDADLEQERRARPNRERESDERGVEETPHRARPNHAHNRDDHGSRPEEPNRVTEEEVDPSTSPRGHVGVSFQRLLSRRNDRNAV